MTNRDRIVRLTIAIGALATVATSAADHELRGGNNLELSLPDVPHALVTINEAAVRDAARIVVEFNVSGATRHTTVADDPAIFPETGGTLTYIDLTDYCFGRSPCEAGFSLDVEGSGVGSITAVATVYRSGFEDDFSSDARIEVTFDAP